MLHVLHKNIILCLLSLNQDWTFQMVVVIIIIIINYHLYNLCLLFICRKENLFALQGNDILCVYLSLKCAVSMKFCFLRPGTSFLVNLYNGINCIFNTLLHWEPLFQDFFELRFMHIYSFLNFYSFLLLYIHVSVYSNSPKSDNSC